MDSIQDTQNQNPETVAELRSIKLQLSKLRKIRRQIRPLKSHSTVAVQQLNFEQMKAFGEQKKSIACKYATAVYRHAQLLALETRLTIQIYKLKAQMKKLLDK